MHFESKTGFLTRFFNTKIKHSIRAKALTALIVLSLLHSLNCVMSQEVNDKEEVTVEAPYQPSVSDVERIGISPSIPQQEIEKPGFEYLIKSKDLKTPVNLEPIKAAKIQSESATELYKNYVRAGLGTYWTPYIEFNANKLRSKKNAFGVHAKYLASFGGIKDYAYPGSSESDFSGYGKAFLNQHTFTALAEYQRIGVHFYGFKPDEFPEIDLEKNDYRQSYNRIGINTAIESNYTEKKKLHHFVNLKYYYLFDRFDVHEHNVRFDAGLNKNTSFFGFSEREKLGLEGAVDYAYNADTLGDLHSSAVLIRPYYNMGFEQYFFKIGVNADVESGTNSKLHFYPVINAEVQVVKDVLITYAGIYGGLDRNSLKSLSSENPFINATVVKNFRNNKFSQYGGLKGHISPYFDYNMSFENSTIENMPFFVNDTTSALGEGLNNQFGVVYDKVKYSRVTAEFGFHYKSKFNALLAGKYNSYYPDNESEAWHKPALEISFIADYSLQDKIIIRAGLLSHSSIFARTFETRVSNETTTIIEMPVAIKGFADISLGAEYRYSKLLSGFINFNNILSQRYFRWYNYPSYRFNILLGVTYSF